MKKHIIFLFAAVFVAGMSFYGCNDKNAPDNGGGNGNNGNNDGPKELLSPEDAKEYLANEGKKMMEIFKAEDQRETAELAEGLYDKFETYDWASIGEEFANQYDQVFGPNHMPACVVPMAQILRYSVRTATGATAPTGMNYVWSFAQDNFIYECNDQTKTWVNKGKSPDNSAIVRFTDKNGVTCEARCWGEGAEKTYTYTWYDEYQKTYNTLGGVLPASVHFYIKQGNNEIVRVDLSQQFQKNDHAIFGINAKFAFVSWTTDLNVQTRQASGAFAFSYADKKICSAAFNLPNIDLSPVAKNENQNYEEWAESFVNKYGDLLNKIGAADGMVDLFGEVQIRVNTKNFTKAYKDWMAWEENANGRLDGSQAATQQFCDLFNNNSDNGIYFASDIKQGEVRVQPHLSESGRDYEPEGVVYFPQDGTSYAFEQYFNRKPFTDFVQMAQDVANNFLRLSDDLSSQTGELTFAEDILGN